MSRFVAAVAVAWMAGCARPSEVDFKGSGAFGTVPVGESRSIALSLSNDGDEAAVVGLTTEGDFSVEPSSLRIEPKQRAQVTLTFTPREVGMRDGRLIASFRDRQRALLLSGTGTGPRLEVVERVVLPPAVLFVGVPAVQVSAVVRLRHVGTEGTTLTFGAPTIEGPPGLCLGRFMAGACVAWVPSPLASGEALSLPIAFLPTRAGDARWTVTLPTNDVVAPERRLEVLAATEAREASCLVISPGSLDFGTVAQSCTSAVRHFQIYNSCSRPLALAAPELRGSTDFVLANGWQAGTQLDPGATPVTAQVLYRPSDTGSDTAGLIVSEVGGPEFIAALQGRGDARSQHVDRFDDAAMGVADVLIMVDASPSFAGRRAGVRGNLERVVRNFQYRRGCDDVRVAIAPADGDPAAVVKLQANDAGQAWSSNADPAFVEQVLSAYDALPPGSETEACIGPAANLITDAGLRGRFAGLCITDALEQTPSPAAALQRIRDLTDGGTERLSWSVVAGTDATCGVESIDDGVHASLLTPGSSVVDVCNADWANHFLVGGCLFGPRDEFFLSSLPEGAIEVRLDGVLLSSSQWSYDPANNSVRILVPRVPERARSIEVSYRAACFP